MKLSIYTLLFEKDKQYFLYNSETGFFSTVSEEFYQMLFDAAFSDMSIETLALLKKKKLVVDDGHEYEYYNEAKLRFLSNIGVTDSLNLIIAPTTDCNFQCPYCFEGEKPSLYMSDEIVGHLISFINGYSQVTKLNITWYGGEPLLAFRRIKNIIQRIQKECKAKINHQSIISNGYLLSPQMINQMLEYGMNDIQISLDGDERHHNETRCLKNFRKGTYSSIVKNIDSLANLTPDNFQINLRINVNKGNEEDFAVLYKKFSEKYSTGKIFVYPGFIRESSKDGCRMCFKSLFNGYRYDFYKNIADKGLPVDFFPRIELHKGCMVNENSSFVIGPQGELYKCWNDFNSPDKTIGNIKDKNLSSPSLVSRYLFDTSIFNQPECNNCLLFPVCNGGCQWFRYQNMFNRGNYKVCTFMKDKNILKECLLRYITGRRPDLDKCIQAV